MLRHVLKPRLKVAKRSLVGSFVFSSVFFFVDSPALAQGNRRANQAPAQASSDCPTVPSEEVYQRNLRAMGPIRDQGDLTSLCTHFAASDMISADFGTRVSSAQTTLNTIRLFAPPDAARHFPEFTRDPYIQDYMNAVPPALRDFYERAESSLRRENPHANTQRIFPGVIATWLRRERSLPPGHIQNSLIASAAFGSCAALPELDDDASLSRLVVPSLPEFNRNPRQSYGVPRSLPARGTFDEFSQSTVRDDTLEREQADFDSEDGDFCTASGSVRRLRNSLWGVSREAYRAAITPRRGAGQGVERHDLRWFAIASSRECPAPEILDSQGRPLQGRALRDRMDFQERIRFLDLADQRAEVKRRDRLASRKVQEGLAQGAVVGVSWAARDFNAVRTQNVIRKTGILESSHALTVVRQESDSRGRCYMWLRDTTGPYPNSDRCMGVDYVCRDGMIRVPREVFDTLATSVTYIEPVRSR